MLRKQLSSAIAKQMNPKLLKKRVTYVETRLLQTTVWIVEFVIQNNIIFFAWNSDRNSWRFHQPAAMVNRKSFYKSAEQISSEFFFEKSRWQWNSWRISIGISVGKAIASSNKRSSSAKLYHLTKVGWEF